MVCIDTKKVPTEIRSVLFYICLKVVFNPILHGLLRFHFAWQWQILQHSPIVLTVLLWNLAHIMSIIQGVSCTSQKNWHVLLMLSLFEECHNSLAKYLVVIKVLLLLKKNIFFSSVFTNRFLKHIFVTYLKEVWYNKFS